MTTLDWPRLTETVDTTLDVLFGERIELVPWVKGTYTEGYIDSSRSRRATIGIHEDSKGVVSGDGPGAHSKAARIDVTMSVNDQNVDGFGEGDRLVMKQHKNALYEILYIEPGDTGRSLVHLIRVHAVLIDATSLVVGPPQFGAPALA